MIHAHSATSKETTHERVRQTGARVTTSRVRVLDVLLDSAQALSHHDIEARLKRAAIDRVTLYRVLDWLVEKNLAHRIAGADRVWRFSAALSDHREHAHFHCNQCGKLLCLDQLASQNVRLPRGYRSECVELTVNGVCAECQ